MEIRVYDELPSTQRFLVASLKDHTITRPTCILAHNQTNGIGSRGNTWQSVEKGLYFSFCLHKDSLPRDLYLQSASIFFGFICKETLNAFGSQSWLKYPNDLYLANDKIGGILSQIVNDFIVCGIGINLQSRALAHVEVGVIDECQVFLKSYFESMKNYTWKDVFNQYSKEFHKNYDFSFHHQGKILSFKNAKLLRDGSININDEIIYSAR